MSTGSTIKLMPGAIANGTSEDDTFYGDYDDVEGSSISGIHFRDTIEFTDATDSDITSFYFDKSSNNLEFQYAVESGQPRFGYINFQQSLHGRLAVTLDPKLGISVVVSPLTAIHDYDGDAHSDILLSDQVGRIRVWGFTGDGAADQVNKDIYTALTPMAWHIAGSLDANGDGVSDVLWRNDNGAISVWTGTRQGFNQGAFTSEPVALTWHVAATGDINANGRDDILWQNDDSSISVWSAKPVALGYDENTYYHSPVGVEWKVAGLPDLNGDGRSDIVFRNDNGDVSVWTGEVREIPSSSSNSESKFGKPPVYINDFIENTFFEHVDRSWHIAGFGDFNGDGKTDILWRNDNGDLTVWQSSGNGFTENTYSTQVSPSWSVGQIGDYNGDGLSDILFRKNTGDISVWHSTGNGFIQNTFFDNSLSSDTHIAGTTI